MSNMIRDPAGGSTAGRRQTQTSILMDGERERGDGETISADLSVEDLLDLPNQYRGVTGPIERSGCCQDCVTPPHSFIMP